MSDKWWDISDDELDDLFREASDKVDIPFDQSSLDKLNQKINSKPAVERFVYLKHSTWLLVALIVFIGAGLIVYHVVETKEINHTNSKINHSNTSVGQQVIKSKAVAENGVVKFSRSIQSAQEKHKVIAPKDDKSELKKFLNDNSLSEDLITKHKGDVSVSSKRNHQISKAKLSTNRVGLVSNIVHNLKSITNIPISLSLSTDQTSQLKKMDVSNLLRKKEVSKLAINLKMELPTFPNINQEEFAKPVVALTPKFSHFGIRVALAPDANAIERLGSFAFGKSAGLLFEYKLSKKFIVQTGVIYSVKDYTTGVENYHAWAKNWATRPVAPSSIEGDCRILDIPLNIRFNVFQKPEYNWFVSTGVSSYLMLTEDYQYYYDYQTTPTGLPTKLFWRRDKDYYGSTFNLSVGFEKKIAKNLTIQAEPYLKTPLTEVGRGKVNLYSSGILFSIKHDF